jgi:Flp pilus assembly protein TadG
MSNRSRRDGQALVEFALVAPIFFLLLFSVIEFGRYIYQVQILNNAAREGARYAIVHGSLSLCPSGPPAPGTSTCDLVGNNIKAVVRNNAVGVASTSITFPTLQWDPNNGRESTFTIVVQAPFQPLIPIVPIPDVTVTGSSSLVMNN